MISRLFLFTKHSRAVRQYFSTATLDRVNYYNILGVESGATNQQIHKAYKEKSQNITPSQNPETYQQLSEAFVILSNNRSRDAYDSLLKSNRISYLNDIQPVQAGQKSYIAERRDEANRLIRKQLNIDEFGRYKGGLPKKNNYNRATIRGNSANNPGQFATRQEIESYSDRYPEYNIVDSEVAESFKNFHQKEREARTMKEPWMTLEVDYEFFTFKTFRTQYLPWLRLLAVFGVAIPMIWVHIDRRIKMIEEENIKRRAQ